MTHARAAVLARRERNFLGADYEKVIRYTVEEAFADSFAAALAPVAERSSSAAAPVG